MEINQIIEIFTPIISGALGIISSLIVFVGAIRKLKGEVKGAIQRNDSLNEELINTRKALTNLNQKVSYLVEKEKNNDKK